ncbi:unnamed protein product [Linum trigynum]|uniref:Uncharacterized protein n=1 Tax=Linum trigynum TaxID=586398 RepID=A0AAV2FU89_9ROSI
MGLHNPLTTSPKLMLIGKHQFACPVPVTTSGERLGQKISHLVFCPYMVKSHHPIANQIQNIVKMDLDMLCSIMKNRINNNVNSTSIIHKEIHRKRTSHVEITKQPLEPDEFRTHLRHGANQRRKEARVCSKW